MDETLTQATSPTTDIRNFPCKKCGAKLEFSPGTDSLRCPYCSTLNEIVAQGAVEEQDLTAVLRKLEEAQPHEVSPFEKCGSCGAEVQVPANVTSFTCPFCSTNIVAKGRECAIVKPNAVLPFKMTQQQAADAYRAWIKSLWWAPGKLKSQSMLDAAVTGVYLPHWTFDARADTSYRGERGDAYFESQTVMVNGRPQTRSVRKIRWTSVSGRVQNSFDDVLVPASKSLDPVKVRELTPWDLKECEPYAEEYLAGFRSERYSVPLHEGFGEAQQRMEEVILSTIRADIGGDEQRVDAKQTRYSDLSFKYILLPIWVSAYRYGGKVFQFLVNARTGEVQGQRPYSWVKITLAILMALIFVAVLVFMFARK